MAYVAADATPPTNLHRIDEANADTAGEGEHAVVIDLRDPSVADGLAAMLDQVSEFGERAGAAEAKAEAALQERLVVTGRLRTLTDEVEFERAERHRLEVDLAAKNCDNEIRMEQIAQLERQLAASESREAHTRANLEELAAATDELIEWLQNELSRTKQSKHVLEALLTRRGRQRYERLIAESTAPRSF